MKKETPTPFDAADLRRLAEKRCVEKEAAEAPPGPDDLRRLVHELQVHQIELELQNEELIRAHEEIEEGLEKYTDLYEFAPVGYVTLDRSGVICEANLTCAALLGVNRSRLTGMSCAGFIAPESLPAFQTFLETVFAGDGKKMFETALRLEGGNPPFVRIEAAAAESGQHCGAAVIDITERRRAEEELADALRVKEVLLKEIHHRVKNNLSVISSLLNLQAGQTNNPEVSAVLTNCKTRLQSMGLIHTILYQTVNTGRVHFGDYIRKLANALLETYAPAPNIHIDIAVGEVLLDFDKAVPCALILNELFSNALKYAFPDGRGGTIRVSFEIRDDGACILSVSDDGIGLPEAAASDTADTLGLQLVHLLARQINGTVSITGTPGAAFTIQFR